MFSADAYVVCSSNRIASPTTLNNEVLKTHKLTLLFSNDHIRNMKARRIFEHVTQVRELCEAVAATDSSLEQRFVDSSLELLLKSQQLFHKIEDVRRDAAKTLRIELSLKCSEDKDYVDDPIGTLPSLSSSAVRASMDVVPSDLKRKTTKSDLLRLSEMLKAEEGDEQSNKTYLKRYRGT